MFSPLEFIFNDGTYIIIAPESKLIIKKGKVTKAGTTASLELKKGRIWSKVKKVWQGLTKFKVITPSAIVGVKGTIFSVIVKDDKELLLVKEGQVNFTTTDGSKSVEVDKGYMSVVQLGKLEKPIKIIKQENKEWGKIDKLIMINKEKAENIKDHLDKYKVDENENEAGNEDHDD